MRGLVAVRRGARALGVLCSIVAVWVGTAIVVVRLGVTHRAAAAERARAVEPVAPHAPRSRAAHAEAEAESGADWRAAKAKAPLGRRLAAAAHAGDGWATIVPPHGRLVHIAPPAPLSATRAAPGTLSGGSEPPLASRPLVTMLHGMCSEPLPTCELARGAATEVGWYACPTGNGHCGTAADWAGSGAVKAEFLAESLAELDAMRLGRRGAEAGDVLIGFSRGAFVARDVAYELAGRWVGLVLIGAALVPDADRLRDHGIRRVVLAAGDFDGARPTMVKAAAALTRRGLPARFVSLGPIYHTLPADLDARLAPEIAWLRAAEPAS
jgi:hypothetical protein